LILYFVVIKIFLTHFNKYIDLDADMSQSIQSTHMKNPVPCNLLFLNMISFCYMVVLGFVFVVMELMFLIL